MKTKYMMVISVVFYYLFIIVIIIICDVIYFAPISLRFK